MAMLLAIVLAVGLLPGTAWAADSDFVIENGVLTEYIGPGSQAQTDLGQFEFDQCNHSRQRYQHWCGGIF